MTSPVERIGILTTRLRERGAALLFGAGRGVEPADGRRRVFFVVHNKNHMNIYRGFASKLSAAGIAVHYVTIGGHRHQPQAQAAVQAAGCEAIDVAQMGRQATPADLIIVGNDWGPKRLVNWLERLRKRGVVLVGIVEGARFGLSRLYKCVDHLLCWGPSGLEIGARNARITGSPVIEAASREVGVRARPPKVLVNYKFSGTVKDEGFAWGSAAIAAAQEIDRDFVISAHPSSRGLPDHVKVSHEPFPKLLAESTLVITKASTVIYEALAAGVSVLYFPAKGEVRAEFGEPMGAFMVADTGERLMSLAQTYAEDPRFPGDAAAVFLQRHVMIDPHASANERIACALCDIMNVEHPANHNKAARVTNQISA